MEQFKKTWFLTMEEASACLSAKNREIGRWA
jgi:hypothetical protein